MVYENRFLHNLFIILLYKVNQQKLFYGGEIEMKKKLVILLVIMSFLVTFAFAGCSSNSAQNNTTAPKTSENVSSNTANNSTNTNSSTATSTSLTQEEKDGLLYSVEEEKLARDVYLYLYNKWGLTVFKNISSAEQRHMDAVRGLLEKFNLPDPTVNEKQGVFKDQKIQKLYDELTAEGSKSAVDALIVGAKIEEIDMIDLNKELNATNNKDIKSVYENLIAGSENHLRAFVSNLKKYGVDYKPQFLSQKQFDEIINSTNSKGNGPKRGG